MEGGLCSLCLMGKVKEDGDRGSVYHRQSIKESGSYVGVGLS